MQRQVLFQKRIKALERYGMGMVHSTLTAIAMMLVVSCCNTLSAQVYSLQPGQKEPLFAKVPPKKFERDAGTFTFYPQKELDEPFKYRMWLPTSQRKPGSATARVLRATLAFESMRASKGPKLLSNAPWPISPVTAWELIDQLNIARSREFIANVQPVLDELHASIQLEDFDVVVRVQDLNAREALSLSFDEVQSLRSLARILIIDIRLAIAEKRFDDAIRSIQAGWKLVEVIHESWPGLLIADLIKSAVSVMMLEVVEEMMQHEDCPNLYWALATIPDSIWDSRNAIEGDLQFSRKVIARWQDFPEGKSTNEAWRMHFADLIADLSSYADSGLSSPESSQLGQAALVLLYAETSRSSLKKSGWSSDSVDSMSDTEAILRGATQELDQLLQKSSRLVFLPPEIAIDPLYVQHLTNSTRKDVILVTMFRSIFWSGAEQIIKTGLRGRTLRNRLITVAALQAWAAENPTVAWPDSLDKLLPLPAWPDAYASKNFEMERNSANELSIIASKANDNDPWRKLRLIRKAP